MPPLQRRSGLAAVIAATMAILAGPASAVVPDHPSVKVAAVPAWVDPTPFDPAAPIDSGSAASSSVAHLLVDFQILLNGSRTVEYSSIVTQVLTHAGLSLAAEKDISFDPEYQSLVLHHARVFRDGEWTDRLADAQITIAQREADFSRRIYDGSLSVLAVLGDIRVGDVVDVAFSLEGFNPVFDGRYFTGLSMGWSSPVATRRVRILRHPGSPLHIRGFAGADADARVQGVGSLIEHEWLLGDIEAIPYEGVAPPDWESYPWLQISQYGSWSEIVDWGLPLYRVPESNRPAIRAWAAEITSGAVNSEDAALAAVRWIQDELRYFAIVLGPNSYAPHPPAMTIERRFGDCKDKALLLVAILTELGIPAWPALVDTTSGPLVPERQPSPGVFDHVVVVAEIAGQTRWIDPTISFQGGTLTDSTIPDYGFGLVLRAGETGPIAIPREQTDPGEIHATYTYDFSDDGTTASVEVVTEYLGMEADAQRYSFADTTPDELQESYTDYYSTTTGRAVAVEPLEIEDDRRANRIVTREHYRLEDWWYLSDGEWTFDLLPILLASLLQTEDLTERRAPLDLPRRYRRFESVRIHAPPEWLLDGVAVEAGAPWFDYRVTPRHDGAVLQMDHELVVGDQPVKPEDIASFNQEVEVMIDAAGYSIGETDSDENPDRRAALIAILVVVCAAAVATVLIAWLLVRWRLL